MAHGNQWIAVGTHPAAPDQTEVRVALQLVYNVDGELCLLVSGDHEQATIPLPAHVVR